MIDIAKPATIRLAIAAAERRILELVNYGQHALSGGELQEARRRLAELQALLERTN